MKSIFLALTSLLGASAAHAGGLCDLGGEGSIRILTQADSHRLWDLAKKYCAPFIESDSKFEEVFIKSRAGIRFEGHLQTNFIHCRKSVDEEIECQSTVVWRKDWKAPDFKDFKNCGDYHFHVTLNPDRSKSVRVLYNPGFDHGYTGGYLEGVYRLVEETDGDVLVLEKANYGGKLSVVVYGGSGLSDLDCHSMFKHGRH